MTLKKIISWMAVILWMTIIFYLSDQPATQSSELSNGITEVIVKTVERVAPHVTFDVESFGHFLRKNAHFFAYLLLGVLVMNALRRSGMTGNRSVVTALGICVLYAVSDEVHQLFILGRSGEVTDVLIDSAGVSVGIGLYLLVSRGRKKNNILRGYL